MDNDVGPVIQSIFASVLATLTIVIPAFLAARSQRRQDMLEESRSVNDQLNMFNAQLDERIKELRDRVRALESENDELRRHVRDMQAQNAQLAAKNAELTVMVRTLAYQLQQLGHRPAWYEEQEGDSPG